MRKAVPRASVAASPWACGISNAGVVAQGLPLHLWGLQCSCLHSQAHVGGGECVCRAIHRDAGVWHLEVWGFQGWRSCPPPPREGGGEADALEGKGPQRWPQKPLDRRLEEFSQRLGAVTVGYKCH